ncbi:gem-associated protein 8 [Conger conger]|uniref:gem-associated protein 8 n=1 Tax=Conger conger TaxID=82655 RepID=UPI002A5991BB|nr:gem-associated protein 8 [Conger conger]
MAQHAEVFSWFTHPVYNRYWQHYRMAMSWQERHKQAYRRALAAYAFPPFPWPNPAAGPPRYADWHAGEHAAAGERSETDERDSGSDSEIECDVSNMEITDELRQYFAQTEKHREELKEQQRRDAEQQASYVLADRDLHRVSLLSAAPPVERPGQRRAVEMRRLYGEDAARIQGMETAVQLAFDRNCDRKQPKYWPVIPLRL